MALQQDYYSILSNNKPIVNRSAYSEIAALTGCDKSYSNLSKNQLRIRAIADFEIAVPRASNDNYIILNVKKMLNF